MRLAHRISTVPSRSWAYLLLVVLLGLLSLTRPPRWLRRTNVRRRERLAGRRRLDPRPAPARPNVPTV